MFDSERRNSYPFPSVTPDRKAFIRKTVNEIRSSLPRLPEERTKAPHVDNTEGSGNQNAELLGRIQFLEREITRCRNEYDNGHSLLLGRYETLESKLLALETQNKDNIPTIKELCDTTFNNEKHLNKVGELITKIDSMLQVCEKAIHSQSHAISRIREDQKELNSQSSRQGAELDEVKNDTGRSHMIMSRLASISDALKN